MNMTASKVRILIFYLPPLYKMKCEVDDSVMSLCTTTKTDYRRKPCAPVCQ